MELDQEPESTGKNDQKRRIPVKDHVVLARGPEEASLTHLEQCQESSVHSLEPWEELSMVQLPQWAGQWVEQWAACLMLPVEQCRGSLEMAACQEK